eukprot:COSAG01_NODE_5249_length_4385_cov_9.553663_2_plen_192_part_00
MSRVALTALGEHSIAVRAPCVPWGAALSPHVVEGSSSRAFIRPVPLPSRTPFGSTGEHEVSVAIWSKPGDVVEPPPPEPEPVKTVLGRSAEALIAEVQQLPATSADSTRGHAQHHSVGAAPHALLVTVAHGEQARDLGKRAAVAGEARLVECGNLPTLPPRSLIPGVCACAHRVAWLVTGSNVWLGSGRTG